MYRSIQDDRSMHKVRRRQEFLLSHLVLLGSALGKGPEACEEASRKLRALEECWEDFSDVWEKGLAQTPRYEP